METDIGNPIEYDPQNDPLFTKREETSVEEDSTPIMYQQEQMVHEQPYYYNPSEQYYPQHKESQKIDFLSNIEKTTWIIAFAVFLLGFFMGKTMQPVILRYA
jgi:hypothetical protein